MEGGQDVTHLRRDNPPPPPLTGSKGHMGHIQCMGSGQDVIHLRRDPAPIPTQTGSKGHMGHIQYKHIYGRWPGCHPPEEGHPPPPSDRVQRPYGPETRVLDMPHARHWHGRTSHCSCPCTASGSPCACAFRGNSQKNFSLENRIPPRHKTTQVGKPWITTS